MNHDEALDKLISIRHYCFYRGVLYKFLDGNPDIAGYNGQNEDFRQVFRTLNRLYVTLKHHSGIRGVLHSASRSKNAVG